MSATWRRQKPEAGEFPPYYQGYVDAAPPGDVVATLEDQRAETVALLRGLTEAQGAHRYASGKWSVKEVVGHLSDAERVFAHRALRFARNDPATLPGFDENAWVPAGGFDRRTTGELADEWEAVRRATLALFRSLDDAAAARRGVANKNPVSVRALAWICLGHTAHHLRILRERYLS